MLVRYARHTLLELADARRPRDSVGEKVVEDGDRQPIDAAKVGVVSDEERALGLQGRRCVRGIAALYVLHEGRYVAYFPEAPHFVNRAFAALYAAGVPALTPLVAASEGPPSADPVWAFLEELDISQNELARHAGISPGSLPVDERRAHPSPEVGRSFQGCSAVTDFDVLFGHWAFLRTARSSGSEMVHTTSTAGC